MARNRKYRTAASRFGPALKAFLLCLLIGGSGVGYVWQKDQIHRLSQQIKERETRLKKLKDENEKRRQELARLRLPSSLDAQNRKWNLGLTQPQMSQVLRLAEPTRDALAPSRQPQYALEDAELPKTPR
jgi:hypothetical protein